MNSFEKIFFHVDLDAFFASVEQNLHPEFRGKPVIVGGKPGDRRAVVSTASYEARAFGVHSAMPLSKAVELCPEGIFVRGNHRLYAEISGRIMAIFRNFSPTVIQISIDEAFIDMTGTEKLFGNPADAAKKIKSAVKNETGLTVSIGISSSMYVAKIASGYRKPDGITIVPDGSEEEFMLSLPLEKLWGIGGKTQEKLKKSGIFTTKSIHQKSRGLLTALFGESMGNFLYESVRGNKSMTFGGEAKNKSVSAEKTFDYDLTTPYAIETALMELSEQVMWRLFDEKSKGRTVTVKIRYEDFKTVSAQESSDAPVTNSDDLFERSRRIFYKKYRDGEAVRLLGVGVSNIESEKNPFPGELFDSVSAKKTKLEKAIFEMESKNRSLKIRRARLLDSTEGEQNNRFRHDPND